MLLMLVLMMLMLTAARAVLGTMPPASSGMPSGQVPPKVRKHHHAGKGGKRLDAKGSRVLHHTPQTSTSSNWWRWQCRCRGGELERRSGDCCTSSNDECHRHHHHHHQQQQQQISIIIFAIMRATNNHRIKGCQLRHCNRFDMRSLGAQCAYHMQWFSSCRRPGAEVAAGAATEAPHLQVM